jgi:A/G-specific adenine glycosylase
MIWRRLAAWYRAEGRDLPWRRTEDPYRIAVSEFMLQQTQVDRVIPSYRAFLKRFRSWKALASAPQADVVRAWKGLGYNMRAVRLKKMAEEVVTRFGGKLPSDGEALIGLYGIGPYTARALRVFAFRQKALAPDTNLRRVLTRVFKGPSADPKAFDEAAWTRWEATLPEALAYDVNQGLMDLGAAVCKAGRPRCEECPIRRFCASYPRILSMESFPKQKAARKERVDRFGVPDRIYRGRVIEALRSGPKPGSAFKGFTRVLSGLERDGLIRDEDGRWVLA